MSNEGTRRYTQALDTEYDAGKVAFTFAVEHLGTREILPSARTDRAPGRELAFTGKAESQGWFVPEGHDLMQSVAKEAAIRRGLPRTYIATGIDAPVATRLPKQCSFGGIGTEPHSSLIPSMAVISGAWSLWAPSFGKDAIDFDLMRTQLLAIGDTVVSLQGKTKAELAGPYTAWRKARGWAGDVPTRNASRERGGSRLTAMGPARPSHGRSASSLFGRRVNRPHALAYLCLNV